MAFLIVGVLVAVLVAGVRHAVSRARAAERALRQLNHELERRVAERTCAVGAEVAERRAAEAEVRRLNRALEERVAARTAEVESLFAHAPVGIAFFDREARYLRANTTLARISGRPPDAHVGRRIRDVVPDIAAIAEPMIARVFATGEAIADVEVSSRLLAATGDERCSIVGFFPVLRAGGEVLSVGVVVVEITERKLAEAQLHAAREAAERSLASERAARADAERASRMKDEFLATLSHELRTPLNAILGWAQLLQRPDRARAQVAKGLEIIERNTRLQAQLITDLLDVSRIVAGKLHVELRPLELPQVIEAALDSLRAVAATKRVVIESSVDVDVGALDGDAARLTQVVINLVSNAVKFTPEGGRVAVSLERRDGHVVIAVRDTGQGIAPEFLPHVFERFRQADASTTRRHGGLGLGLSIVKHLVERHGGVVRAESPGLGRGATFTVELPEGGVSVVASPSREEKHGPILRGVEVLVVDDEPDARELAARVLEEGEARVRTAASAAEAIAAVRSRRPQVLVSDIGMADMDGYALLGAIGADVPAIALTAFARPEDRERALAAGYRVHLAKPIEPAELVAAVAALAGSR